MKLTMLMAFTLLAGLAFAPSEARAAELDGKWEFVLDTDGGERRVTPTFHVEDGKVTGKWDGADVKGTFHEGKLELKFPFTSQEGGISDALAIQGEMKDGKLAGTWNFAEYSGKFVATKSAS